MTPLHAFRKTLVVLGTVLALAVLASFLPDDPYQRWQLLGGTIHANARWIYERCHFDPTPIDVVVLGPSRAGAGVNAPQLSKELAAKGLPANVVNFSLPENGRDINFEVAEQLFATKKPKLIIIGVIEKPSRYGHSAYKYLAESNSLRNPGYFGNLNFLSNAIYLPYRQIRLFIADILPEVSGLEKKFQPLTYSGSIVDTTGSVVLPDGTVKEGEAAASMQELARGAHKLEAGTHPPLLPAEYGDLEFGDERVYIRKIAALAQAHGAKVAFLFLPYYSGPDVIQEEAFYKSLGPVWNAGFLASHAEWFADYGHLTRTGASVLTDWLVPPIQELLNSNGATK
jgi:hypothetical protein